MNNAEGGERAYMREESDPRLWSSKSLKRERLKTPIIDLRQDSGGGDVSRLRLADGRWLIFRSPLMAQAVQRAEKYAPWGYDVCILGERGTGKELFARLIHDLSGRTGPFKALNSAALPPDLVESVLFGHTKGAFTGATESKVGYFESAEGGTLFLDEIGDLPMNAQAKILRTLQERTITRVGSTTEIKFNTRIVAATNQDLGAMMKAGTFRNDLIDRFKIKTIIPPLRKRPEDITTLAPYFLEYEAGKMEFDVIPTFSVNGAKRLLEYGWPGNVRELENVVYMALIETLPGASVTEEAIDMAIEAQSFSQTASAHAIGREIEVVTGINMRSERPDITGRLPDIERVNGTNIRLVLKAVQQCGGNQAEAAKSLGLSRQQVHNYVRRFLLELDF